MPTRLPVLPLGLAFALLFDAAFAALPEDGVGEGARGFDFGFVVDKDSWGQEKSGRTGEQTSLVRGAVEAGQRRRAADSGTEGAKADMVVVRMLIDGRDGC